MNGGEISGNLSGGSSSSGVSVTGGATFTMNGGKISSFHRGVSGGGVGSFTMNGGEISGNTSYQFGGGVYVNGSTFIKTGGTIFGCIEGDSDSNAVREWTGAIQQQQNIGHAVHIHH